VYYTPFFPQGFKAGELNQQRQLLPDVCVFLSLVVFLLCYRFFNFLEGDVTKIIP
jgi:hypothetical protein